MFIFRPKKFHLSDFWSNTLASTIGTIVGIVLTFGTSHLIEGHQEAARERHIALMVIKDIDNYCNLLESTVKRWEERDSINKFIKHYVSEDSIEIADSTLHFFLDNIYSYDAWIHNTTTQNIFNSNIEIWQDVSDLKFIENAGKCFTFMSYIDKRHKEYDSYTKQAYESYQKNILPVQTDDISLRQKAQRTIQEAYVRLAIVYLSGCIADFKQTLVVIRRINERNKKIMNISDEDLIATFKVEKTLSSSTKK